MNLNNIPKRIGQWTPKLTDEAKVYAANMLACDVTCKQIAKDIKDKFNIEITPDRLNKLTSTKKYYDIYCNARKEYIKGLSKNAGVYIKDQISRLKKAQDLLELVVVEESQPWVEKKEKIETALKILKFAQDEEKVNTINKATTAAQGGSLVGFINNLTVNNPSPTESKDVVEVKPEELETVDKAIEAEILGGDSEDKETNV